MRMGRNGDTMISYVHYTMIKVRNDKIAPTVCEMQGPRSHAVVSVFFLFFFFFLIERGIFTKYANTPGTLIKRIAKRCVNGLGG